MASVLETGIHIALPGFIVGHMLALGMRLTVGEIAAPLKRGRLVALALVANFVVCPVLAILAGRAISLAIPLDPGYVLALSILGGCAGSPMIPKWVSAARGDEAFGVGLMVLLMGATIAFVPLVMPRYIAGLTVDPVAVAKPLVLMIVLPFAAGLLLKARAPRVAAKVEHPLEKLSMVCLVALMAFILALHGRSVLGAVGTGAIAAWILFQGTTLASGYLLGGPGAATRRTLAVGSAQRNIEVAFLVAAALGEPKALVMGVIAAIAGLVFLLIAVMGLGRSAKGRGGGGES